MRLLMISALACLALAACRQDAAAGDPLAAFGRGVEWRVTEVAGQPVPEGTTVTMEIREEGLLGGTSGCNRYNGRINVVDGALHLGELAGTRMMCPETQMQTERNFHAALSRAKQAQATGDALEITDATGQVLIRATK